MNLGLPEMVFIFILALLVFGPRRLPEIGRQIGRFMAEFKRYSNEFKNQVEAEVRQLDMEDALKKIDAVDPPPKPQPPQGTVAVGSGEGANEVKPAAEASRADA